MNDDTLIELKIVDADGESLSLPITFTLKQLSDYILASFDGETEPAWAV